MYLLWAKDYYQFGGRDTGVYPKHRWSIQLLIDHYGQTAPPSFGPLALKKLRELMVDMGLAMSTVNARVNIIRQCFRWGAENELCDASVFHSLQVVRGLQKGRTKAKLPKKIKPVAHNAIEAIQPYLLPTVGDMILLQMHSGMRYRRRETASRSVFGVCNGANRTLDDEGSPKIFET